MTRPLIHLRNDYADLRPWCLCGAKSHNWTDDSQAVTCNSCIEKMELQSA